MGTGAVEGEPGVTQLALDRGELVGLNVEEHQVRPRRPAGQPELLQQVELHQHQRAQQEGAEPDRQHHRHRLIGRAVQVRQALPPE